MRDMGEEFSRAVDELLIEYKKFGEPTPGTISKFENGSYVEAAKEIVKEINLDENFRIYIRMGLEHFTIEHLVTDPRFLTLFTITDRSNAIRRLRGAMPTDTD
jgi:hypothetical protein